jgi:hypothetical protein
MTSSEAHPLRQLQNTARRDTIARMTITYITLAVAVANLAVSLYYLPGLVRAAARTDVQPPTVGTKGAGGGGW